MYLCEDIVEVSNFEEANYETSNSSQSLLLGSFKTKSQCAHATEILHADRRGKEGESVVVHL